MWDISFVALKLILQNAYPEAKQRGKFPIFPVEEPSLDRILATGGKFISKLEDEL
jgi:hypothetical protein